MRRGVDLVLGLVYLGLAVGLVATSLAVYRGAFSHDIRITLEAGQIGNALREGSEVKFLGVPVGTVQVIRPHDGGASIRLAVDKDRAKEIPRDSVGRMVPESLFGERYVSIVPRAAGVVGTALADGDRLTQDTSDEALQAEDLFEGLLPVLRAVKPAKLNATLGELAVALRGQGAATGDAFARWGTYLAALRPYVPALARDLELLGKVAHAYADASPDLLAALDDLTTTTQTLAEKRAALGALLADSTKASDDTSRWLEKNSKSLVGLSEESRSVLTVLARYAPLFPCVSQAVTQLMPRMDRALGDGTGRPGLRADVQIVPGNAGDGGWGPALRGCPTVGKGDR